MRSKKILIFRDRIEAEEYIKKKKYKSFLIYLTNDFFESKNIRSIPLYIENNSKKLRNIYINNISKIGNKEIKGEKLYEYNIINKNNSLWWQSGFIQKSNFSESKEINIIIKLIAINLIIKELNISEKEIYFKDKRLRNTLQISVKEDTYLKKYFKNLFTKFLKVSNIIISFTKAIIWLNYFLINNLRIIFFKGKYIYNDLTIFTYNQDHIIRSNKLEIRDKYWTRLYELLEKKNKSFNVVNIFIKDKNYKNSFQLYKKVDQANTKSSKNQFLLLESYLNLKILIKTILSFIKLSIKNIYINYDQLFYLGNINYKKFYKKDFFSYFFGKGLIKNIIYTYLFNEIFKFCKNRQQILYLNENAFWEYSLLSNSKKHNVKNLIACPHLNIKEWDLRMFHAMSTINKNDKIYFYLPNIICAISDINFKNLVEQYKKNVVIEKVEALRFIKYSKQYGNRNLNKKNIKRKRKILVIGEYDDGMNKKLIEFIEQSNVLSIKKCYFLYKPHPSKRNNKNIFKNKNLEICNSELTNIKPDVAICSSFTSASIDTSVLKIPTITILDNTMPNFSPLKGLNSLFITSEKELKSELIRILEGGKSLPIKISKLFFLNEDLDNWSRLFDDLN